MLSPHQLHQHLIFVKYTEERCLTGCWNSVLVTKSPSISAAQDKGKGAVGLAGDKPVLSLTFGDLSCRKCKVSIRPQDRKG